PVRRVPPRRCRDRTRRGRRAGRLDRARPSRADAHRRRSRAGGRQPPFRRARGSPMSTLPQTPPRARRILVLLPLAVFLALTAIFLVRLFSSDPSRIPSALIGRPAPAVDLPPVAGLERDGKAIPGISAAEFRGNVTLVNGWA